MTDALEDGHSRQDGQEGQDEAAAEQDDAFGALEPAYVGGLEADALGTFGP